jgi:DNA-directed RNA polymerase specialized sigma24 family protein
MTEDLLRRLREGEPTAHTDLFEHCQQQLRPFFRSRLPNTADLDDCVSEVFTRALEGIRAGGQPEVLGAWLIGIARNLLKQRYEASNRAADLDDDLPQPPGDPQLELARTDLPELPSDLEIILGKRQLWATLGAATSGLNDGLATIMRAHITLSVRRKRLVVGAELAATVGMPVDIVNRQLQRSRTRMLDSIAALVLARTGRADCPGLDTTLSLMLRPEQRGGDRRLRLDPTQTSEVLKHANGCATCGSRVDEARDYSRWVLGPGLLHLADDDEERRRAVLALLDRAGEGQSAAQSSAATVLAAAPVPLAADVPAGIVGRIGGAVRLRVTRLRWVHAVTQFAQDNPDTFHRIIAAVSGGAVVVAAIAAAFLANHHHEPEAASSGSSAITAGVSPTTAVPPGATSPATPAATSPGRARPVAAPLATTTEPAAAGAAAKTPTTPTTTTSDTRPPPAADHVDLDATDTDYGTLWISGTLFDPRQIQHLGLAAGSYTLAGPGRQAVLDFEITGDHRVTYDPALEGAFTGNGTSRLTVHGYRITLDTTAIDYSIAGISGLPQQTDRRHTFRVLPGNYYIVTANGRSYFFDVTNNGRVTYDAALEGHLTGAGTATLAVHGFPITLDVTDVVYQYTGVNGTYQTTDRRHTYRLLPGPHYIVALNEAGYGFTVTDDGPITYDPAFAGRLAGAGTTILAVHGFAVTIDATGSGQAGFSLAGVGTLAATRPWTLRLLPISNNLVMHNGQHYFFQVDGSGHVDYDHRLDPVLSGRGTSTLTIRS